MSFAEEVAKEQELLQLRLSKGEREAVYSPVKSLLSQPVERER